MKVLEPVWVGKEDVGYGYKTETGVGSCFKTFSLALSAAREALIISQHFDPFAEHKGKDIIFTVPNNQRWVGFIGGSQQFFDPGDVISHSSINTFRRLF